METSVITSTTTITLTEQQSALVDTYIATRRLFGADATAFAELVRAVRTANGRFCVYDPITKVTRIFSPCVSQGAEGQKNSKHPYLRIYEPGAQRKKPKPSGKQRLSHVQKLAEGKREADFSFRDSETVKTPRSQKPRKISEVNAPRIHLNALGEVLTAVFIASKICDFQPLVTNGPIAQAFASVFGRVRLAKHVTAAGLVVDIQQPDSLKELAQRIKNPGNNWGNYRPQGFLVGIVDKIDEAIIYYTDHTGQRSWITCAKPVLLPSRGGEIGPYLLLGLVRQRKDRPGDFELVSASVRPILSANIPFPVDSNYERLLFAIIWALYCYAGDCGLSISRTMLNETIEGTQFRLDLYLRYRDRFLQLEVKGDDAISYLTGKEKIGALAATRGMVRSIRADIVNRLPIAKQHTIRVLFVRKIARDLGLPPEIQAAAALGAESLERAAQVRWFLRE